MYGFVIPTCSRVSEFTDKIERKRKNYVGKQATVYEHEILFISSEAGNKYWTKYEQKPFVFLPYFNCTCEWN